MRRKSNKRSRESDPDDHRLRSPIVFRLILALSIPVYVGLTLLIAMWLPDYAILALIPAAFALHSAAFLLSGREP
jgi:hypothetical protein